MAKTLEIFPNLALYREETTGPIASFPKELDEVSAFIVTPQGIRGGEARLINAPFSPGTNINVDGQEGFLDDITEKYVDLVIRGTGRLQMARIYEPKTVTMPFSTKDYLLPEGKVVVTGLFREISWSPSYRVILSDDPNLFQTFLLMGEIDVQMMSFPVDRILLHTRRVLSGQASPRRESRAMMLSAASSQIEEIPVLVEATYELQGSLVSPMSVPLTELNGIPSQRLYFLEVVEGARPTFGYSFEARSALPGGRVKIYDQNLSLIGASALEIIGRRVILKVAQEENLIAEIITEQSRTELEEQRTRSYRETIKFTIALLSRFNRPVECRLELPITGTVIESEPQITERLPGRLVWSVQVPSGKSTVEGRVVIQQ